MRPFLLIAFLAAACGEGVDTTGLPSTDGYQQWTEFDFAGPVPGHGDTYRKVFVSPTARTYLHGGRYPVGSVLVKEIHELNSDGTAGSLKSIAIMRKVRDDLAFSEPQPDPGVPLDHGWLFTETEGPDGEEEHYDGCWSTCHKQAPYDGAWSDYGE